MAQLDHGLLRTVALARFASMTLPAGTDRTRYANFITAMAQSIGLAWGLWQAGTRLVGVTVNGPIAVGGKLFGPQLDPLIAVSSAQLSSQGWNPYTRAIAAGLHNLLKEYCDNARVPGLPWYPSFAAYPGAHAPPTPNPPTPLFAMPNPTQGRWVASQVAAAIIGKFGNPPPPCGNEVAKALAEGIEKAFLLWITNTQVTRVMGRGPVPSYKPPFVLLGPVVGGTAEMPTPGGLI